METMAGASINIGMRAAIYEKPLEPDRGHAVRERPCGAPVNVSIAVSPSIVVNKTHASRPTIGLSMTDLRPRIGGSSNKAQSARDRIPANRALCARAPEMSRPLIPDAA